MPKVITTAERYHDFSMGHRVYGHESKCAHLHGHNYRFTFTVAPNSGLDDVGRVLDFSVIKSHLCEWLEENWDHKFLVSDKDPIGKVLKAEDPEGVVIVPFNPTAENMAEYFLIEIAPHQLLGTACKLVNLVVEETRKCSATVSLGE